MLMRTNKTQKWLTKLSHLGAEVYLYGSDTKSWLFLDAFQGVKDIREGPFAYFLENGNKRILYSVNYEVYFMSYLCRV